METKVRKKKRSTQGGDVVRLFKTMELLLISRCTANKLSEFLDIDRHTVQRHIKKLEDIGFIIDQDFSGKYFINTDLLPKFVQALNVTRI